MRLLEYKTRGDLFEAGILYPFIRSREKNLIGTALLQVLQNLVNLLGIPSSLNFAVMGAVILIGVMADQILQRRAARAR